MKKTTSTTSTHRKHSKRWYAVVPHLNERQRMFFRAGLPSELTLDQAAEILDLKNTETLRRWDNEGLIKARRIGSRRDRRIPKEEILRIFKEGLFKK